MNFSHCPICDGQEVYFFHKESGFNIDRCLDCSFAFVRYVPDEQTLHSHYQHYLPSEVAAIRNWRMMMKNVFIKSLNVIERETGRHNGELLDIGCGYGFFLELAKKKGWSVSGIEPCEHARTYSLSNGIQVDRESLFEKPYEDERFDVVTLFYVLEHLPDPLKYLKEINRILKSDGLLLIRVPDTTPLVQLAKKFRLRLKLYDVPSHLCDFSPYALALALRKTGFIGIRTFPGGATRPAPVGQRCISQASGIVAELIYGMSRGTWLLPGVSKTTLARKC